MHLILARFFESSPLLLKMHVKMKVNSVQDEYTNAELIAI